MKRELLMGIDIGTQSTRAALLTLDGQVIASASRLQDMATPRPGWAEQDPNTWWNHTKACVNEVLRQANVEADEVLGIGVGGQMHGTVPLDANGELLSHNVQLWCDKRSAEIVDTFKEQPAAGSAYRKTGSPPVANWIGFKIKWLQQHDPQLYANTWKFVVPKDFINYKLTGEVSIDYSEASGSFLMDAATRQWSSELLEELDLDGDKLPPIRRSADVIGHVTADAAAATGLAAGTPVVAGGGDMLCMLLAAGLIEPGAASDITGTSSIFSVFTEAPVYDDRLMNLHHVTDGWIPFGITDSGGVSLKWFKDNFCQHEISQAQAQGIDVYDILNKLAADVPPGSEGLLFFPYLMGERTLGTPYARANFFGITPRHNVGAMVRAIMEGVSFELKRTLEIVENAGHEVNVIYHSGGGAYSDLWSQIKADIYQKPVSIFENTEGGILGAAILAGVGVGAYENETAGAKRCLQIKKTFMPNDALTERYNRQFALFKEVHDLLQEPFNKLPEIMTV
jgi:xylulokinase